MNRGYFQKFQIKDVVFLAIGLYKVRKPGSLLLMALQWRKAPACFSFWAGYGC